jgi:hypothetical protein
MDALVNKVTCSRACYKLKSTHAAGGLPLHDMIYYRFTVTNLSSLFFCNHCSMRRKETTIDETDPATASLQRHCKLCFREYFTAINSGFRPTPQS